MTELHEENSLQVRGNSKKKIFLAPMSGTERTDTMTQIEAVGQLSGDSKDLVNGLGSRNLEDQEY
jgi:hypothetical protein